MAGLFHKIIIGFIVIGLLVSLPLIYERINWENTSKQVEVVVDYDDLFILFYGLGNPEQVEREFLEGIQGQAQSIALYEETLARLKVSGQYTNQLWVYSGRELLEPTKAKNSPQKINSQHTYILFSNDSIKDVWDPILRTFLSREGEITDFDWDGYSGFEIAVPYRIIKDLPLGIDPILAGKIKNYGFGIVPRISNGYKDKERTIALVEQTAKFNPTNIIFQGTEVTGFPSHLIDVATVLSNNNIRLGMVEIAVEQLGIKSLGFHLAHLNQQDEANDEGIWYHTRVHSLSEYSSGKLINLTPAQLEDVTKAKLIDLEELVELAVTERNIRLIYIHPPMGYSSHVSLQLLDNLSYKVNPKEILAKTQIALTSISNRLNEEGYTQGQSGSYQYTEESWMSIARWLTLLGGISVIALLASVFFPSLQVITLLLGLGGIVIAKLLSLENLYFKFIALGTAVSVPVLAIKYSLMQIKNNLDKRPSIPHIFKVYLLTSIISILGAFLVIGMFSHLKYTLYLDQFRGVTLLYSLPILITIILVMWNFNEPFIGWLKGNFKNYYVVIIGIFGVAAYYYLMRSGNEATVSSIEIKLRSLLQTTLDIRPRTKEFLIAYPIFILGIYLSYTYRRAAYLLVGAVMGQLSIISTFTHLHTPFIVSFIRTILGLGLGLIIGLILVIVWKLIEPLWKTVERRLKSL